MARRNLNEPTNESNVSDLLKGTNEAGKLVSIVDLIEQKQQELRGYVERIESKSRDLGALVSKKETLLAEVSTPSPGILPT